MAGKLKQLQAALETLQSYSLPSKYNPSQNTKDGKSKTTIDPDLIARYKKAKSQYLKQRITELLIEHVETFDGTSFQFPPVPDNSILEKNREDDDHICKKVKKSAENLAENVNLLLADYETFRERREELQRMVNEMEAKKDSVTDKDETEQDSISQQVDGDIDEEQMKGQEEKLAALVRKRMTLQQKLKQLKEQKQEMQEKQAHLRQKWNEEKENHPEYSSKDFSHVLSNLRKDREKMELTISQLKEKTAWYKSVTEAFEELGGMKIIGAENIDKHANDENNLNQGNAKDLKVKLLLLDKYLLDVTLSPISRKTTTFINQSTENLTISNATLQMQNYQTNVEPYHFVHSQDRTVTLPLPHIADIIPVTHSLPPKSAQNLRFFLHEVIIRLRATESRAEELSELRRRYLTKVLKSGQEVVCSLNEGITIVIRLTPDCPIVMGSAYVEEIVGIGGWNESDLEQLKVKMNRIINSGELNHARQKSEEIGGPIINIMDLLSEELEKLKAPGTPKLPLIKKN